MKLAYMVITTSSWLLQMIAMLIIQFLSILILLICHGMNDIITNRPTRRSSMLIQERKDRRRKRERHMKIKHRRIRATLSGVDPHLQRPDHGDQVSGDEWVYTSLIEDNTAWEAVYSFSVRSTYFTQMAYTLLDRDNATSVWTSI